MYLHEEILLLALKDDSGKIDWQAGMYRFVMAGALIAELLMDGRIAITGDEGGKKKRLHVVEAGHHADPVLDDALQTLAGSDRDRDLQYWVRKLAHLKDLRDKTAGQLCRRGILAEETGRILFVFPTTRYPERDPEPERQLIARLEAAIFGEEEVDVRTAVLVSLTHKAGLLGIPFAGKALRRRKRRIEDIVSGEAVGQATGDAIQSVQAAMTMVAIMPAITAASCTTTSHGC